MEKNKSHMSVKETDNQPSSEHLYKRREIEGTPFTAIQAENKKWFLVMGNYKVTDEYDSFEMLEKKIQAGNIDWEILTTTIGIIVEAIIKNR